MLSSQYETFSFLSKYYWFQPSKTKVSTRETESFPKENHWFQQVKPFVSIAGNYCSDKQKPAWKSAQSIPNHLLFRLKTSDFPQKNAGIDLKKHGITCKKSLIVVP